MPAVETYGYWQVAYSAAETIVGYRAPRASREWVKRAAEKFWPFVNWVTQPRSVDDFVQLKRGLLEQASRLGPKIFLLGPVFPNFEELFQVKSGEMTADQAWKVFEDLEETAQVLDHRKKIVGVPDAAGLAKVARDNEARVGFAGGKWGLGPHREHLELLSQAKTALGAGGKLIVTVESQRAIIDRRPGHHKIFDDEERLYRMAAVGVVDAVTLVDPETSDPKEASLYYEGLWRKIRPSIYFIGDENSPWRDEFEARARRVGAILLWVRGKNTMSTTELLRQVCT